MARNAAIPPDVERRRRHMENEGRIAILCWKWATEQGDFFCGSEMITFIFPSNEISPEWERERRTAQVVEEGGKHFVRRHVRGGSRLEEESWRGRTRRDIMRMCGVRASIHFICVCGPLHHRAGRGEKGGGKESGIFGRGHAHNAGCSSQYWSGRRRRPRNSPK